MKDGSKSFQGVNKFCAVVVWVVHCNELQQEVSFGMVGPVSLLCLINVKVCILM